MSALTTILRDFADWSTLSGLKHIITTTSHIFRLLWTIIFIALCGVFGFMLYLSLKNYFSYPSSFTSQIVFEEQPFPRVTVCNANGLKYRQMAGNPSFARLYSMLESYRMAKEGIADPQDLFGFQKMDRFEMEAAGRVAYLMLAAKIVERDRVAMTYSYSELVSECTFDGKTCTSADFTTHFHPDFGRCYTFTTNRTITRVGAMTGLRLLLTANAELASDFSWANLPLNERVGFRVVVHSADQFPAMEHYGVNVASGQQTSLGVSKYRMERLAEPWGQCTTNQSADVNFYSGHEYTLASCLDSCRQSWTISKCGCAHPIWHKPSNASYCGTMEQFACLLSLRGGQLNTKEDQQNLNAIRDCGCHDPCIETAYRMTVSLSSYPAVMYSVGAGTNEQFNHLYNEQGGGRDGLTTPSPTTTTRPPDNEVGCLNTLSAQVRDDLLYNHTNFDTIPMCNEDSPCKLRIRANVGERPWYTNWPCYYAACDWPSAQYNPGAFECKDVLPYINLVLNSLDKPGWPGWEVGAEPTDLANCRAVDPSTPTERSKECEEGVYMNVPEVRWKLWLWGQSSSPSGRKKRAAEGASVLMEMMSEGDHRMTEDHHIDRIAAAGPEYSEEIVQSEDEVVDTRKKRAAVDLTETSSTTTSSATTSTATWPPTQPPVTDAAGLIVDMPGLGSCDSWNLNFNSTEECNTWYARNGAILQVYIESLQYTKMVQSPSYTLLNILVEIGGNAGLWLGMSVVSCVELLGLAITLLCFCLRCGRSKPDDVD